MVCEPLDLLDKAGEDLYSDVAQLGTPHPFDLQAEDMNLFCSQSAISAAESFSEELSS